MKDAFSKIRGCLHDSWPVQNKGMKESCLYFLAAFDPGRPDGVATDVIALVGKIEATVLLVLFTVCL